MSNSVEYRGASWDDLAATLYSEGKKLWAELTPANGTKPLLVRAKHLGSFRSGGVFLATCVTQQGKEIELIGHCPHRTSQEVEYSK